MLFDFGFDVVVGFIYGFDVLVFNFFYLIKINKLIFFYLNAEVAFFNVKIKKNYYYFNDLNFVVCHC